MLAFKRKQVFQNILPFKARHQLNDYDQNYLQDIIKSTEGRVISKLIPKLKGCKVLSISKSDRPFIKEVIADEKPAEHIQLLAQPLRQPTEEQKIIIDGKKIPIKQNTFDHVIASFTETIGDDMNLMSQLASSLKAGGCYLLSVRHPCLDILTKNQHPTSSEKVVTQIQDYIDFMRRNHLYLENLKEGLIGPETKSFFTLSNDENNFDEYIGIPLVISFRFVKYIAA